ncbi:MAG TPA: DUF2520 domain-containing protein [Chitinophagaceae bacterium]|nr:DUF2520 domain-containing protein [Chitinophagaceae bacterium]
MKVVIIGSGNTATVLGRKIKGSDHIILQVTGRNEATVHALAADLGCSANTNAAHIDRSADIYIVAIADKALPRLHQWLQLDKKMVVHTAAAVSKDVLRDLSRNYGVLYPLQTLRKEQQHIPEIPFLVDGNTADDLALVQDFARSLSDKVWVAGDQERLKMHVAAVFASNFTNHLYGLADGFCKQEDIDFLLLLPLIEETARRLQELSPQASQTGPAIRHDAETIQKHLQVLSHYPALKKVYEDLTESIQSK